MHNAIIDIKFSDTQTSTTGLGSASILTYKATGGEFGFQDDRLIGATIFLLFRDGLQYMEIDGIPDPNAKEFDLDEDTGDVMFADDPMPPLQTGEIVTVFYASGDQTIILTEPYTLDEGKAWCKIEPEITDDDDLITDLIPAARSICEEYTGQSFVQRVVTAQLRNDLGNIRLPYGPVGEVTSLKDLDGTDIEITDTTFIGLDFKRLNYTNGIGFGGDPRRNGDMILNEVNNNIFTVVYSAGYSVLPKRFKTAIKQQLIWMYQHRGEEEMITQLSPMAKAILNQSRAIV